MLAKNAAAFFTSMALNTMFIIRVRIFRKN